MDGVELSSRRTYRRERSAHRSALRSPRHDAGVVSVPERLEEELSARRRGAAVRLVGRAGGPPAPDADALEVALVKQ